MEKWWNTCRPGRCLCGALSTIAEPPEVGKRLRVYDEVTGWVYVTWNNGDQALFSHWRPKNQEAPCEQVAVP